MVLCSMAGCRKVPLQETYGEIQVAAAHWFETEGVAYVFFSLSERPDLKDRGQWQLRYEVSTPDGGTVRHGFEPIDFSSGVHQHALTPCRDGRICGSYSFRTTSPLVRVGIRYVYDAESPLDLERDVAVQNHESNGQGSSYSALAYGIFDKANEHVQVRIHNNFGVPASDEVRSYGLLRRFAIADPRLAEITMADFDKATADKSASFAFPAAPCGVGNAATGPEEFLGEASWFDTALDGADGAQAACFHIRFLDKEGGKLLEAEGLALRNPVVGPSNYTFETPLREAIQLRQVISYCQDDPAADEVTNLEFLDYQRFILGMPDRKPDVCFRVGALAEFEEELEKTLRTGLENALAANPEGRDFIFVIAYHQILSREFHDFHQAVATTLNKLVESHAERVSPRLIGAFVYDTDTEFKPTAAQRQTIIWCPQALPVDLLSGGPGSLYDQNCTNLPADQLDLKVINFVTPLGPFPSLGNYLSYVEDFGDKGVAGNPELIFKAVQTSPTTRQEKDGRVTFFDNERITLAAGEAMRTCPHRSDSLLGSLRFRTAEMPASLPSMDDDEVDVLWRTNTDGGEYALGISWSLPYIGAVEYTSTVTGKVVSAIPFQRSGRSSQALGDPVWTRETWDIGRYIEHCRKYCDHPVFDSQGVYQVRIPWKEQPPDACPEAKIPVYEAGT